jgi:16S rRNA (cytosine1402-N4)-methyltransferase
MAPARPAELARTSPIPLTHGPVPCRTRKDPTGGRCRRPIISSLSDHTMEGPYSARFPSSPTGEKSRRTPVVRGTAEDRARSPLRGMATMDVDDEFTHRPVMVDEVVSAFGPVPAGLLIDATLGGAGHAVALLESRPDCSLLGLDRDGDALAAAAGRLARFGPRATAVRARFDALAEIVGGGEDVVGVLLDLGVSSPQLDRPERGFSYRHDAPLDMRMDPTQSLTAAVVVNEYGRADLARILRVNGDERFADRIASAIVAARPVETTLQLVDIVRAAIPAPARRTGGHPAKRTFQAIRIEVNDELGVLRRTLPRAIDLLVPGGRIAVLTYHSGEDRIVKDALRLAETGGCTCPPGLPCACGAVPSVRLVRRGGLTPSTSESEANPRAQSARLRVAERR